MGRNTVKGDKAVSYLLVEGKDDEHVFYSLLEHYQIPERFKIKNKEGINKLLDTLDVELDQSGLERLGIVIDADTDLDARWKSLRHILIQSGYSSVPQGPKSGGTILTEGTHPTVGIWLMPDNTTPGMLEDFVSFLVRQQDALWPLSGDIVAQVMTKDCRFPPAHKIKARLHTWLAWQEEPGKPMGLSITARYLDADALHAQQLIKWLRQLFDLPLG